MEYCLAKHGGKLINILELQHLNSTFKLIRMNVMTAQLLATHLDDFLLSLVFKYMQAGTDPGCLQV